MLLMALYGVRSERQLCEQLRYNMMFRWFLDMSMSEDVFDASTFSKNRERFLSVEMTAQFFDGVVEQARTKRLMSDEHFSVDGTLIEAWASMNSYQKKDSAKRNDDEEPRPPASKKKGWRGKGEELSRPAQTQPNPRLQDRSRGQALPQGIREGGQAVFHWPRPQREPKRSDRRHGPDWGVRDGRARSGSAHAR